MLNIQRTSWQIMCDTIHALLMREIKTRFGANRLGYFWAIAEPFAQAGVFALIFTLIGRESIASVPIAVFLITGFLPYKLFAKLLPQLSAAISANKALFGYRQVTPIDPILTRLLIEVVTFIVVYLITLAIFAWFNFEVIPDDILSLFLATFLLILFSLGLGLLLCSATCYWQDTPKLLGMVMTPMFLISGVIFSATMIPEKYWFLFSWNPIFHFIELSRDAFFTTYQTPIGNWYYASFVTLTVLALGLMTYYINRQKFITA